MAIDPNAATAQPSGWALGGLGAPSQSTIPLAPRPGLSPADIAQMRQNALALQTPPAGGIHHWTQGLAELVRAIQGNREADFARQQEAAGRQQGAEATSSMLAPYLSPGGAPAPAAGGAPAGAGGGASIGSAAPRSDASGNPQGSSSDPRGMEPYIRETAAKYGVDPDTAMKVAQSEGLSTFLGDGGKSGGAFQLYTGGGMGNDFQKDTGLDPLDPKNEKATIDYALKNVPRTGWTPFHGARRVGIGERDGILPQPDAVANTPPQATAPTAPTGLLAPIQPPATASAAPAPAPSAPAAPAAPTRLAYAGNPPPGMVPPTASPLSPMISAIAGQPIPPADFAKQAAAMEAAKAGGAAPLPTPGAAIPPADFASQAAAMEAAKGSPTVPPMLASLPAQANPAAVPPTPVPQAGPTAPLPPPFIPSGGSTPGAIGPTAVNGQPLDYTASLPRPPLAAPPAASAPMVNAIAGRPMPPNALPAAGGGAPIPTAPVQVAQNGPPTSAVPSPTGGPSGLPQPLTSPTGQINQAQLTQMLANPWVPDSTKAAMLNMIQQRGQVQTLPMEGGILQYDASGRRNWIPQTVYKEFESNGTKMQMEGTRAGPNEPMQWKPITPGAGGPAQPGAPDYSTPAGRDAIAAAAAAAKKGAETSAETGAKYYDSLHKGLAGSAMIASQQKQNIDALRQIANSPDFVSGTFADSALAMQRMASSLGINPTGAAPRELFNQLAARVLADQFSGLKSIASETGETGGRVFKPMLDIEEKANITPEDSAEGINAKLNLLDNAGNLMMKYGDMADEYVAKNGKLDPTFDKELRKEIAGSRIPNVVPQAAPKAEPSTAPTAPVTAKTISTKDEYDALPSGTSYVAPDGSTRTKK